MTALFSNYNFQLCSKYPLAIPYHLAYLNNNRRFRIIQSEPQCCFLTSSQSYIVETTATELESESTAIVPANRSQLSKQEMGISFQIMTRAEPADMVRATIASLLAIKETHDEIIIVDNNHSDEALYRPLQAYCEGLDESLRVRFIHQDYIPGFKAGALNLALKLMDPLCQYIVVVDSDYQALPWARSRIIEAISRHPDHALLQFPQYYRDAGLPDIHSELNHYFSYHIRRDFNRYFTLSTGTFAVINTDILRRLGGWSGASITEDAQMGVLMHRQGARSQFIPEIIATGLLPTTLIDLIGQRQRWIYGNMQVLFGYFRRPPKAQSPQASLFVSSPNSQNQQGFSNLSPKIKLAYIRAHLSQLSAWVNFTGPFIGLHSAAVLIMIAARLSNNTKVIPPVLTVLTVCYLAYGLYLSRRLLAYLKDTQPLTFIDDFVRPEKAKRSDEVAATTTHKVKKAKRKTRLSKWLINTAVKVMPKRLMNRVKQRFSRFSNNLDESNNKTRNPRPDLDLPNLTTPPVRSLKVRLRTWLVHLNFWELGALSWLPVLWGRQKPFVCTPKAAISQSHLKTIETDIRAIPKLLIVLNALTAILVVRHSPALFVCALTLLTIKLAACGLIIANFVEASDRLSDASNQMSDTDATPQRQSKPAYGPPHHTPELPTRSIPDPMAVA